MSTGGFVSLSRCSRVERSRPNAWLSSCSEHWFDPGFRPPARFAAKPDRNHRSTLCLGPNPNPSLEWLPLLNCIESYPHGRPTHQPTPTRVRVVGGQSHVASTQTS